MKDLKQWQGKVVETKALANKLLTLYANDDTHKVTQDDDNMMATWTHINKRYSLSLLLGWITFGSFFSCFTIDNLLSIDR